MTPSLITVGSGVCGRSGGVFGSVVVEVCSVLKVRGRPDAVVTFAASPGHMADERSHRPAPYTQPFPWWWQPLYIMTESFPVSVSHASRQPLPSSDSLRLHLVRLDRCHWFHQPRLSVPEDHFSLGAAASHLSSAGVPILSPRPPAPADSSWCCLPCSARCSICAPPDLAPANPLHGLCPHNFPEHS